MTDEQGKTGVNIGYALGQLWRALGNRGETAERRASDWRSVLAGSVWLALLGSPTVSWLERPQALADAA